MTSASARPEGRLDRIEMIRRSLRCLVLGLLGLLPVIGLPMAALAIVDFCRVAPHMNTEWNPARRHLMWGLASAVLGLLLMLLLGLLVIGAIV